MTKQTSGEDLRREIIASRLHVVELDEGRSFVMLMPGEDGALFSVESALFESRLAAELFRREYLESWVHYEPEASKCSSGYVEAFNLQARLLAWLDAREAPGDRRALMEALERERPWEPPLKSLKDPDDIPF